MKPGQRIRRVSTGVSIRQEREIDALAAREQVPKSVIVQRAVTLYLEQQLHRGEAEARES